MIDKEQLNKAGLDYAAGMTRFMNDPELYEAVLCAFVGEDIPARATEAYEAGNHTQLLLVAHEAKGSCGNAGLDVIYEKAVRLVTLLRSPEYTDSELEDCYFEFIGVYNKVRDSVRAALGL